MLLKHLLGVSCPLTFNSYFSSRQWSHSPILGAQISAPAAVWRGSSTARPLPAIPAAFPTNILLTQLQIRVVLPKKTNVQQVTVDQVSMIVVFSQPCSLLCHLNLCKVIQSKAHRNSVKPVHLIRWWWEWLCRVQVVKRGWSLYLHLVYVTFYCLHSPSPFSKCSWVTLGAQEGKVTLRQWNYIGRLDIWGRFVRSGRTVRHTGEFSAGNLDKKQVGGIKWQRGHCLLRWLVKKLTKQ